MEIYMEPNRRYAGLSPTQQEFLDLVHKVEQRGPDYYVSTIAILCAMNGKDIDGFAGRYTRGDHKRAIKLLREARQYLPEYAESYEAAVKFIREHWLHRETTPV